MKNTYLMIVAALLLCPFHSFSIGRAGLYMNARDYRENKLTYGFDCKTKGSKIQLHDVLGNNPNVTVLNEGRKYEHKKNEVFGFRDCDGRVYRFANNAPYMLVDSGNIFIYTRQEPVSGGKGFRMATNYYFSTSADAALTPLSVAALQKAFARNDRFLEMLNGLSENFDVRSYDHTRNMYSINTLFLRSLK